MPQYGKTRGWEYVKELDMPQKIADELLMLQKMIKEGKKAPKEKIDIVCGPEVVGIAVHESCGHPYEADRILGREAAQAGESFVTQSMLGTKIGSEIVTVIDDPTCEGSYGHYLFDDEGVAARPRELIRNGVINEFLQNRETATEFDVKSNAASRAQYYGVEPIVRMSNTYMKEGDHGFDELFEGITLGVFLKSFTEWNIDDKRYNQKYVGREAYLIENGKVTTPVRRPVLELTTPKFYSSVTAIGKEVERSAATCGKGEPAQGVPVDTGGPAIRLGGIVLGG
jgi:TldD protein